ncbi:MAG: hypothetical protein ACOCRX_03495 [Candidatus Woesearchaeota archaeon]
MKKIMIIISLLLVVSLLSSCDVNTDEESEEQFIFGGNSYAGGTNGIEFSFERDSPPETIYNDDTFEIVLEVENLGEYDISQDEMAFTVWNLPTNRFNLGSSEIGASLNSELLGVLTDDGDKIPGDRDEIIVESGVSSSLSEDDIPVGGMPFTIKAGACYRYKTESIANVCLVGDDRNPDQVCDPNSNPELINSGSPIQVKNFKQSLSGSRININFIVSHEGDGEIFYNDDSLECSGREINEKNLIDISISSPRAEIDCNFDDGTSGDVQSGELKLYNNERFVTCEIRNIDDSMNRMMPFEMELDFIYYQDIQKEIFLRR